MTTHIQTWIGSARIIDMANAGKRGKQCRTLRIIGAPWDEWSAKSDDAKAAARHTRHIIRTLECLDDAEDFEAVRKLVLLMIDDARTDGVPESYLSAHDEAIKGIHAPKAKLVAGVDGKWSASADENGVCINDLADQHNMPRCITSRQTENAAYRSAAKAWPALENCRTFSEAWHALEDAGCRLHYYCAMD